MGTVRQMLREPGLVRSLAVHDVFSAMVVEQAGIELLFAGGFGIAAAHLGTPDLGIISLNEMADAVRRITDRVHVPLIADGDTGHGDLHNVVRTVQQFERAGAAGMLLEDQQWPKRCGHFDGKQLVSTDEMLAKLRVALDARQNDNFIIIARTDARAVEGLDAAIERANRYGEAGADMCFVEAPTSREELARVATEVPYPQLANMLVGGATPILSADELAGLGFKIMVCPVSTLLASAFAMKKVASTLVNDGQVDAHRDSMISFDGLKQLLGLGEMLSVYQAKGVSESDDCETDS